jgi:hypothetical protein
VPSRPPLRGRAGSRRSRAGSTRRRCRSRCQPPGCDGDRAQHASAQEHVAAGVTQQPRHLADGLLGGPLIWLCSISQVAALEIVSPGRLVRPGWPFDHRDGHETCLPLVPNLPSQAKQERRSGAVPHEPARPSHLTHDVSKAIGASGNRRPRRSNPRRRNWGDWRNGRTRGRPPRPSTGALPCRRDPAGRCRAPMTRSSGGSARTCRRKRGIGSHSVARWIFYPPARCPVRSAALATGAESPFAEVRDDPFGEMVSGAGAGGTVAAGPAVTGAPASS